MRLLFDENISPTLPKRASALFPDSRHVRDVGLLGIDELAIFRYAASHGFMIVTKDDDYSDLSILHGAPPKIILLRVGNCSSTRLTNIICENIGSIRDFSTDAESALLEIYKV